MKATDEQMARLLCKERQQHGNWLVSVPHGPYSLAEYRRFLRDLPDSAAYHDCVEGQISGGNGVGWPGYYDLDVLAIYQPEQTEQK